ncbi:acyltransferase family protein [Glaciecola sp. 1036]|uniref:acyltransferase family protein n=1 Tax=Alteromonadaceae TaxID=72275 RepID=UPI003D01B3EF
MKKIFYLVCFLIAYGSLYPFTFELSNFSQERLSLLLNFSIFRTNFSDIIANIVLFVPFGFLFCSSYPRFNKFPHFLIPTVLCFIFAYVIQIFQLWFIDRAPWGGDAIWNLVGFAFGACVYAISSFSNTRLLEGNQVNNKLALVFAIAIILLQLSPFAPTVDFQVLKDNIKQLIANPDVDFYWVFENFVLWTFVFFCLSIATKKHNIYSKFIVLTCIVLGLKFIIISSDINLSKMVGALLALSLWPILKQKVGFKTLSVLMFLVILGNGLYPFTFRETQSAFNWIPFTGAMGGNILLNILAVSKKLLFMTLFIWSLYKATNKLMVASIFTSVFIFLLEYTQTFFIYSVPESTDALLALFAGFILHQVNLHKPHQQSSAEQIEEVKAHSIQSEKVLSKSSIGYIASLDGLRAIAAVSVFIVHFQQFTKVSGSAGMFDFERLMINGNTGVALFFILSGFLLSMPFWGKAESNQLPNIKEYFANRALRIIPIYYICLFALLALKGFSGADANFNNIISHLFFLHNLKDYQVMSLNPPFWTLAVEFQFYLLLPLFFLAIKPLSTIFKQTSIFLLAIGLFLLHIWLMHKLESYTDWPITFSLIWPFGFESHANFSGALKYSTLAHLPHFLLGVFTASIFLKVKNVSSTILFDLLFWSALIASFIILATPLDDSLQVTYGRYNFPYIPLLLATVLLSAPLSKTAKFLLESSMIKFIGVVSYGIYIFHYPIQKAGFLAFNMLNISLSDYAVVYGLATFVLTLFVAGISYYFIERPIMRKYKSTRIREKVPPKAENAVKLTSTKKKGSNMLVFSSKKYAIYSICLCCLIAVALFYFSREPETKIQIDQPSWAGNKTNEIIFDHHAHTTYSDGSLSVDALVEQGYLKGCDAMSITDHGGNKSIMSLDKFAQIRDLREQYKGMLIFNGVEVGMPSYFGREHVNILVTPASEERVLSKVMANLLSQNDLSKQDWDVSVLEAVNLEKGEAVAIYNHPTRKDESLDENMSDLSIWNKNGRLISSISGAPGHQNRDDIGSYFGVFKTKDRWDPGVEEVGGFWDKLLEKGQRIWGAIASSDFHDFNMDYAPCEFSRIHIRAPEFNYKGIITALDKGTFWADHGKLLKTYDFSITASNSNEQIFPGGTIKIKGESELLSVNLSFVRNEQYKDDFMRADIITNCGPSGVALSSDYVPPEKSRSLLFLPVNKKVQQCYVRTRLVRETPEEHDLSAYSNPIFIEFE